MFNKHLQLFWDKLYIHLKTNIKGTFAEFWQKHTSVLQSLPKYRTLPLAQKSLSSQSWLPYHIQRQLQKQVAIWYMKTKIIEGKENGDMRLVDGKLVWNKHFV